MTALIYNHTQDKVIMSVEGCVPESRTTRVDQGSIMMADVSMRGTRLLDEQES